LEDCYRQGKARDVEAKARLARAGNQFPESIRGCRNDFSCRSGLVEEVLRNGTNTASGEMQETPARAKEAMGLGFFRENH
jgi:hypothetical protein